MSDTGYIVLERSYGYNDETYYPEEGGNAIRIHTTRKSAEAAVLKLNIEKLSHIELRDYAYDLADLCSFENKQKLGIGKKTRNKPWQAADSVEARLALIVGENAYNDEGWSIPSDLTDAKYKEVFDLLDGLNFYYIKEADIEG